MIPIQTILDAANTLIEFCGWGAYSALVFCCKTEPLEIEKSEAGTFATVGVFPVSVEGGKWVTGWI